MDEKNLEMVEEILGLRFNNQNLLKQALTHRSFSFESLAKRSLNNERLEFLGDSILSLVISDFIFRRYPKMEEGEMAKLRASLVNADTLFELALYIELGECLFLGKGAEKEGGREKTSILADAFEALIGAIYLDQGLEAARKFILKTFKSTILRSVSSVSSFDSKTRLQELSVKLFGQFPQYKLVSETGPVHEKIYEVKVLIGRKPFGTGEGSSKKKAEQAAAEEALDRLKTTD